MGRNSWDSYGPSIDESAARANAAVMAKRMRPHGNTIFTIGIQWYEPGANSYQYRRDAELAMDQWGRLIPASNRFPSAADDGAGFKPLADHIHSLGLKFGLHMLRGVPRQELTKLDDFTLSLLANDEVLGVNQSSEDNREIFRADGLAAWQARPTHAQGTYLAVFNLRDAAPGSDTRPYPFS